LIVNYFEIISTCTFLCWVHPSIVIYFMLEDLKLCCVCVCVLLRFSYLSSKFDNVHLFDCLDGEYVYCKYMEFTCMCNWCIQCVQCLFSRYCMCPLMKQSYFRYMVYKHVKLLDMVACLCWSESLSVLLLLIS